MPPVLQVLSLLIIEWNCEGVNRLPEKKHSASPPRRATGRSSGVAQDGPRSPSTAAAPLHACPRLRTSASAPHRASHLAASRLAPRTSSHCRDHTDSAPSAFSPGGSKIAERFPSARQPRSHQRVSDSTAPVHADPSSLRIADPLTH